MSTHTHTHTHTHTSLRLMELRQFYVKHQTRIQMTDRHTHNPESLRDTLYIPTSGSPQYVAQMVLVTLNLQRMFNFLVQVTDLVVSINFVL